MRKPERKFLGLTWVGWLNFVVLQWFGIRYALIVTSEDTTVYLPDREIVVGWGLCRCPPLTNWSRLGQQQSLRMWVKTDEPTLEWTGICWRLPKEWQHLRPKITLPR